MYTAYKLNEQGDNIQQPYCFPNCESVSSSMFSSNCCFLTHIQLSRGTGKVVWYSHIFKNFPQCVVIHTVKGFSIVNEAEVDDILEFPCFLHDPRMKAILSLVPLPLGNQVVYLKFSVHVLLKPSLKDLGHYLASM